MTASQAIRLSSGRMTVAAVLAAVPAGVSGIPGTAAGAQAS